MDFDEYDYLERTVEIVDASKSVNGRVDGHSSKKRNEEHHGYEHDERSKRSKTAYDKERLNRRERERVRRDIEDTDRLRHKEYGRERERERSHSKSHNAASHRDREREREREREIEKQKDKEKGLRDRDHDREYRSSRERRDHKDEPPPSEPEADPERDQRTVFAYQICLKADERDVYEFFSKAGKVRDVRLIMDRNSRRSKGVGYIEFYDVMSVPMAIAMSGQLLRGLPVMVKPSEAEKNLVQSTASTGATGYITPYSGGARRLYVGNLHFNITEDQLRQVFEPFGPVELVQLPTDPETGQCKGFGFVQYTRLEDARTAQQALNGVLQLAGRVIKVSSVTDQPGMQEFWLTPGELDDDDGGGLSLTAQSRALLMQKLDRSGTVSSAISSMTTPTATPALGLLAPIENGISPLLPGTAFGQVGRPGVAGTPNSGLLATTSLGPASGTVGAESVGAPTDCLLLRNMFDPKTETEPDFDLDIKDEVQSECSKFGLVKHIFVDKNSAGHVYIRFGSLKAAADAQRALHGRWFAGKMVTTTFLTPRAYEAKFPESR